MVTLGATLRRAPPRSCMQLDTASVCYVRALVPVMEAAGLPESSFLERLGIDRQCLSDASARISKEVVARAWQIAVQLSRDESVGLRASLQAPLGTLSLLDHLAANQPTVGEALRSMARYCRLGDPEVSMRFELAPAGGS